MPNPIPPFRVTTPYGTPGAWSAGYHTGDDYSTLGVEGYPVYATHRGWVVSAAGVWGSAYGVHVVVQGPAGLVQVGYCHLSAAAVSQGQRVRRGDRLGWSGSTGRSTGPHLHYEERRRPFRYANHRRPRFNRSD